MSDCPTCGVEGCYNSGFTVECQNPECSFFSQKQVDILLAEYDRDTDATTRELPPGAVIIITSGEITTHHSLSGIWRPWDSELRFVPGRSPHGEILLEAGGECLLGKGD